MMPHYIPPIPMGDVFTCPYCDVTAKQKWYGNERATSRKRLREDGSYEKASYVATCLNDEIEKWAFCECEHCKKITVWHSDTMIYPSYCPVDEPNADMPETVKDKYIEAANVVLASPASAAALLRLALQILLQGILQGESTGKIHSDIAILQSKAIDSNLIKALDIIRISGNESVHPGTLDFSENKDDALYLFDLLNMICDQCFTQPNRLQEMYERMPESKRMVLEGSA